MSDKQVRCVSEEPCLAICREAQAVAGLVHRDKVPHAAPVLQVPQLEAAVCAAAGCPVGLGRVAVQAEHLRCHDHFEASLELAVISNFLKNARVITNAPGADQWPSNSARPHQSHGFLCTIQRLALASISLWTTAAESCTRCTSYMNVHVWVCMLDCHAVIVKVDTKTRTNPVAIGTGLS